MPTHQAGFQKHDEVCWNLAIVLEKMIILAGLEIATDTVANATNIFSLATKNSSLVAKVATRFLYDLDLR